MPHNTDQQLTDAELISAAIRKSGLSARQYATQVLSRDERTIRRWIAGQPIPKAAKAWLIAYLDAPNPFTGRRQQRPTRNTDGSTA